MVCATKPRFSSSRALRGRLRLLLCDWHALRGRLRESCPSGAGICGRRAVCGQHPVRNDWMASDAIGMKPTGRIVIAGGTGFLGENLARHLVGVGSEVVVISRHPAAESGRWHHAQWDGRTLGDWVRHLDGASALVNLSGRTVDCVKTPDHCDEILRSRVEATEALGHALRKAKRPPPVWIQMSTAHRYGDPPDTVCEENAAFGYGLAPFVGHAWEEAYARTVLPQMRQVILRTSFVLGRNGGALPRLATLARWGLGGKVGHGRQGISWIHEQDMDRLFTRALSDDGMKGAYLATAPNPVPNAVFMGELRRALMSSDMVIDGIPLFPRQRYAMVWLLSHQ